MVNSFQFIQFCENSFQHNQIQVSHCGIKQSRNQNEKYSEILLRMKHT